ncbi:prepilin-type N-terminal cleavage/methylation domain-containing protein [Bremerella sp. JC770]|uniref:pilus assembly FimT family protein n=1 Tax=Bremerella sp. JC770 TaxID=3232137 RepID=UPI0034592F04
MPGTAKKRTFSPTRSSRPRRGLTLVEILITVAILGILAAAIIPQFGATAPDQVRGAAQIVASDIDYARSLAISNNSTYLVTFDKSRNGYVLTHSGTNTSLDDLPDNPFRKPSDDSKSLIVLLSDFPHVGSGAKIAAIVTDEPSPQEVTSIELGALGQTTRTQPTLIWLSSRAGAEDIYLPIEVNPVTGLTTIGEITTVAPNISSALPST